ncbi:MAG: hypothetical protein GXY23_05685 [Myxococcales bacterium]|nr:hypothetical protein [Myxococcales bacterium]
MSHVDLERSPSRAPADVVPSLALLMAGAMLTAGYANRWGAPLFGWIAPVPFLLYARRVQGRGWWALFAAVTAGSLAQTVKVVTDPISPLVILPFGLTAALGTFVAIGVWRVIFRRRGEVAALYAFPAATALKEWALLEHTELGMWGTYAAGQVDSLELLQLASLAGVPGIGFLMAWVGSAIALVLGAPGAMRYRAHVAAAAVALLAANLWGGVRVHTVSRGPTVAVGAVTTSLGLTASGLPSAAELAENEDALFRRTELAAERGARVVVWNEAATLVPPAEEARLVDRGREHARRLGVDLVLAYGTIESESPLLLGNRYAWISSEGEVLETYEKHHPVPGEPSIRGDAPLRALDRPWGRSAGAICYDYDFPAMAREHARLGVGLVAVPASDWLGIDPYHTQFTRIRAIEGGFSVVRPVRDATSAAYDPYGRLRGAMSAWEDGEHVMVAAVPVERVETVYAGVGDWPLVVLCVVILAGCVSHRGRLRGRRVGDASDGQARRVCGVLREDGGLDRA